MNKDHDEIERKFLISSMKWYDNVFEIQQISQGYLEDNSRIRIVNNNKAYKTIKEEINHIERINLKIEEFNLSSEKKDKLNNMIKKYWNNKIIMPKIELINNDISFELKGRTINIKLIFNIDNKIGEIYFEENNKKSKMTIDLNYKNEWNLFFDSIMVYKELLEIGVKEIENEIDLNEGLKLLSNTVVLEKERHLLMVGSHLWEIDHFNNLDEDLYLAEIELKEVNEKYIVPEWIGAEVTFNKEYKNFNLIKKVVNDRKRKYE